MLLINTDFRVFNDLIDRFVKEFGQPNVRATVTAAVRGWFEQALVEAVIGVQALNGSKEWNTQQIDTALSEEALTAVADDDIKRVLGAMSTLVDGIGSFRTHAGSAHGHGRAVYKLQERHATLAVNASYTLATFVIQTWNERTAK